METFDSMSISRFFYYKPVSCSKPEAQRPSCYCRCKQLCFIVCDSSITYKLKFNGGDIKSAQGDSEQAQSKMVSDVYSRVIDEDRRLDAQRFEEALYAKDATTHDIELKKQYTERTSCRPGPGAHPADVV